MSTPGGGRIPKRPRPVTVGAWIAIVSSSLLLLSLPDTLKGLHTTETRQAVEEFLRQGAGSGLDASVDQVLEVARWYVFVSGVLGAAALVFAIFVLQRHRGARIGLTVTAGLLVLTTPVTGLMALLVCVAVFLVWSGPGRDWYRGRTGTEVFQSPAPLPLMTEQGPPPSPYPFGTPPGEAQPTWPPPQQPPAQPPAGPGPPVAPPGYPPYSGYAPYPYPSYPGYPAYGAFPGYGVPAPRDPNRRPWTVTAAAVLTFIGAGATALLMLMFVLVLAAGADSFVRQFDTAARDSNLTLTREQVLAVGWGVAAVFLFWSVISIVLAVLAVRRSNGARIALAASAGMTVVVSLIAIMSVISAFSLLLGIAALVLLFTGGANEWYRTRGGGAAPIAAHQPPFGPPGTSAGDPASWPPPAGPPAEGEAPPMAPPPPATPPERPKPW